MPLGDTWTWDGSTWTQLHPTTSPPARGFEAMAFDPALSKVVMFGGSSGNPTPLADTWAFDGTTWAQQFPAHNPPGRFSAVMAFDPAMGADLLFGGATSDSPAVFLGDTWSYDGTDWTQPNPPTGPSNRDFSVMDFDTVRHNMVLFSGDTGLAAPNDTWTFTPTPALQTAAATVAGSVQIPLASLPPGAVAPSLASVLDAPFKNSPFKNSPFKNSPFKNSPFKNLPFKNSPFKNSPFKDSGMPPITLDRIPLAPPDSWSAELAGTPLANDPLQNVTLQQVMALPNPPPVTLGEFDMAATPLANVTIEAFLLGTTPMAVLGDVCPTVANQPATCTTLDPRTASALDYELAGDSLQGFYAPPLRLPVLAGLTNSPMSTASINDWAFNQSPLGNIATAALPTSIVACPPSPPAGTCDTLGHAEDAGDVVASATVAQLFALPPAVIGGFTLADLVPAIIAGEDMPVSSFDLATIERLAPTPAPGSPGLVTYSVSANLPCTGLDGLTISPQLPPGFKEVPGSAMIGTGGGALAPANLDPTTGVIAPAATAPSCTGGTRMTATFQAAPSPTLSTPLGAPVGSTAAVTVATTNFSQQISGLAPVAVVDPNSSANPPTTPIPPDTLDLGHLAAPGNTNRFSIAPPAVAGSTVTVTLSHIPAGEDYDIALFGPPGLQLRPLDATSPFKNSPFKNSPFKNSPVGDQAQASGSVASATPAEIVADVPLIPNTTLRAASAQRGNTDESVQFVSLASDATPFVVQVSGFDGSSSAQPYVLQTHVENLPTPLPCQPRAYHAGGTTTALPATPLPATTQALILVNGKRIGDIYGPAAEAAVLASANKLAATPVAGQTTAMGTVLPVDGDSTVAAAYQAWDGANCDVSKTNAVVTAINSLVDRFRSGLTDLRYVVIMGDDEVVPFGRVPDLGAIGNEQGYDGDSYRGHDNATSAALRAGFILSDDPYGDFTPSPWFNGELFVPQVGVGRLVETPADITAAVDSFVRLGGRFSPNTALTTGYDFMTPAAQLVNSALSAQVPQGKASLVAPPNNPTWSRSDLVNGNSAAGVPSISSVANGFLSINGHYDQHRGESALAFQGSSPDPPLTPADLPASLTKAVLFNMGCHAGLNVADVLVANPTAAEAASLTDWAQTVARRGGLYTANSGFGEGDSAVVAYSERLLAYYAQNLNSQMTIGQALMFAKQRYLNLGAPSVYDAKAIEESVFYGLPMYTLGPSGIAAPSVVPVPPPPPPPTVTSDVSTVNFPQSPTTALVLNADAVGHNWFTVNSELPQTTPYEPVQPRTELPLPRRTDGLSPHGVLIEQVTSTDRTGFVPLYDAPVVDQSSTAVNPNITDAAFPSVLASIDHTLTPSGPLDTVVFVPAQFSQAHGERTFNSLSASVESSNSPNLDPPAIATVNAAIQGTEVGFSVTTPNTNVVRAVALFLPKSGQPGGDVWTHVELANNGNGRWSGAATVPASLANVPVGQYFVQLLDNAGNVATSSNKAASYVAPVVTSSTEVQILANGAPPGSIYTKPVTINVTGSNSLHVAVDGAAPTTFSAPFVLAGDGAHTIDATNVADGSTAHALIVISTKGPTATVTSPANNAIYTYGATITASFTCASLVGIRSANGCVLSPSGSPPATAGLHSLTLTATDTLGRKTVSKLTYTVLRAASTTSATASPNPSAVGQRAVLTAKVAPIPAGTGMATGTVVFKEGTVTLGSATLAGGVATIAVSSLAIGAHTVTATYPGDTNVMASAGSVVVTVTKAATKLVAAPAGIGRPTITFSATLTRVFDGSPVAGKAVVFSFVGRPACSATTGSSGVAKCTVLGISIGPLSYTATFAGDNMYLGSTSTAGR